MNLSRRLALRALEGHPDQASLVLERVDEEPIRALLDEDDYAGAAKIVERLSPQRATALLAGLSAGRAAGIVDGISMESAARLLRRVDDGTRAAILGRVDPDRARGLEAVLAFREGTAGALMDPDVLALPEGLEAGEALARVRQFPALARYNLYVVDTAQRLVGAINLRELLLAEERAPLSAVMTPDPFRVQAESDRAALIAHPGWRLVHTLPVVDGGDVLVGVLRYRVLRRLEDELIGSGDGDVEAGAAFAQLIAAGARGLVDAVVGGGGSSARSGAERGQRGDR